MSLSPRVSIVMPVFNDEEWIAGSLESCLRQTMTDFEVICVDDASTDNTRRIIENFQQRDSRIRLVTQEVNLSAFQARRAGIDAANAPYVLFLDGDDELAPSAVEVALRKADSDGADLVGFGVQIITDDGRSMGRFEQTLQPRHEELHGTEIVSHLFPVGEPAQGHLWRYLFRTDLLRTAYEGFPADLTIYRANDLPITFLAVAAAKKYVSTNEKLYRYRFGRGTSGRPISSVEDFRFFLAGIDSIERIAQRVQDFAAGDITAPVAEAYESARLSIIAHVMKYCVNNASPKLHRDCMAVLQERVGHLDLLRASAAFYPAALAFLARNMDTFPTPKLEKRHVLLVTGNLRTGGVQAVLVAQAKYLIEAGFRVTILLHDTRDMAYEVPSGVQLVGLDGGTAAEKLDAWIEALAKTEADLIIDHHVLYNERWPLYLLAARAMGIETIGWLHSFALRQLSDSRDRTSFLVEYLPLLSKVVTLSPTDVAFWKLRGVEKTVYLPNPPSSLVELLPTRNDARHLSDGPIELVWWGRMQQSTKQVGDLIRLAVTLKSLDVDFRLTIIGPDGDDLTADKLRFRADSEGVGENVILAGPLHAQELVAALSSAHVFVSTSVVEGYQLTILEAEAMGIPVAMYDLPWLVLLKDNTGAATFPQGDVRSIAEYIADLSHDPERYSQLSAASLDFAHRVLDDDLGALYVDLVRDRLAPEYSPEPTAADARLLLDWAFFYAERTARTLTRIRRDQGKKVNQLSRDLAKEKRQNQDIRMGSSFRIGRILTFIPRRILRKN